MWLYEVMWLYDKQRRQVEIITFAEMFFLNLDYIMI